MYKQAYPDLNNAQLEADRDLRDNFLIGLYHTQVRTDAWKSRPETYAASLTAATNAAAGIRRLAQHDGGRMGDPTIKPEPGILAMATAVGGQSRRGRCHFCHENGHFQNRCPTLARAAEWNRNASGGRRGGPHG
jgi:hypothetical protein